ncbi:Hsp20/alpha crystallin family protein [Actinokineospora terrae]|uniref:Molecular chaperone IbpA, HSP20 family n=1 Tax=Actinokineospora terrae TaxID=155974 RepID=A0A1H9ME22_9PSEU|nr:Hsp20/alpha crystallin family protein [Actinokineospora terrae]SER22020.1 Molecular chaperone IbpA, HSP20 family [Actinokineospora terrae]
MTSTLPGSAFVPDLVALFEAFPFLDRHLLAVEDYLADGVYVLRAEVPGVDPGRHIKVSVRAGVLTVAAERVVAGRAGVRSDFHYGLSARSITLPNGADIDAIEATCGDGILVLRIPVRAHVGGDRVTALSCA